MQAEGIGIGNSGNLDEDKESGQQVLPLMTHHCIMHDQASCLMHDQALSEQTYPGPARLKAWAPNQARTCGKARVPTNAQNANVTAESAMTPYANRPATASAVLWIGAVRACAISTMRTMSAMTVCCPLCSARTLTCPSQFTVPAVTLDPEGGGDQGLGIL